MTAAAVLGLLAGIGCIGAVYGARATRPSLESIARSGSRTLQLVAETPHRGALAKASSRWIESASVKALFRHPRWIALTPSLSITVTASTQLASRILAGVGLGLLAPPLLWAGAESAGISMSALLPILLALVLIPVGAGLPLLILKADATERRQHFRTVIGTYVDLVVLSLAGGAGIEESLLSASTVSSDWAAKRISKALLLARETGEPAWDALSGLGRELDVPELAAWTTVCSMILNLDETITRS